LVSLNQNTFGQILSYVLHCEKGGEINKAIPTETETECKLLKFDTDIVQKVVCLK
jgi:hypothetical protein